MRPLEYKVSFVTPAFLGNAEQAGQWRTPPFKALLRQWWRVAYAADHGFNVNVAHMRREEGLLFGHAWLDDDHDEQGRRVTARKSLVRIRLDKWDGGNMRTWQPLATVSHPEVAFPVGSDLYLGYGPVTLPRGSKQPQLKANAAIQADESARLSIAVPTTHQDADLNRLLDANGARIAQALWLMDRYGTLGGRSRNGWGSCSIAPCNGTPALAGESALRPWRDALGLDWPHALGYDEKGALIWATKPFEDEKGDGWKALMRELAIIKIGLRTQFLFTTGNNAPYPERRHWLSHPVTKHNVGAWKQRRLPNSLRFKVRKTSDGKLVGVIFHVPCLPPPEFNPNPNAIQEVWRRVHVLLDECTKPLNQRAYASIADDARRSQLKPHLDQITLHRISE